jgi:hypothetical protein
MKGSRRLVGAGRSVGASGDRQKPKSVAKFDVSERFVAQVGRIA